MHNIFELCCEGYDKLLERQFQKPDGTKKKVYICSPFSDPDPDKQRDNMRRARLYMLYTVDDDTCDGHGSHRGSPRHENGGRHYKSYGAALPAAV